MTFVEYIQVLRIGMMTLFTATHNTLHARGRVSAYYLTWGYCGGLVTTSQSLVLYVLHFLLPNHSEFPNRSDYCTHEGVEK